MSSVYRSFYVWGIGTVVILGVFLIFVAAGWPGAANSCMNDRPNSCYCEEYKRAEVISGAPGVRQPVNTWFNLYSILTSLVVAIVVYFDRKSGNTHNLIRSRGFEPDLYIFAVLFLGLGSMWFHASLKEWGGITDNLSMFVYAVFLPFYTIRLLWDSAWFFWVGYIVTVVLFTIIAALWDWRLKSLILILCLVVAYLIFQIIVWTRSWQQMRDKFFRVGILWGSAVVAIVLATVFWTLSATGGPLCDPGSFFQPHGLLWHPLAGVMAVLLYFYWRGDEVTA